MFEVYLIGMLVTLALHMIFLPLGKMIREELGEGASRQVIGYIIAGVICTLFSLIWPVYWVVELYTMWKDRGEDE